MGFVQGQRRRRFALQGKNVRAYQGQQRLQADGAEHLIEIDGGVGTDQRVFAVMRRAGLKAQHRLAQVVQSRGRHVEQDGADGGVIALGVGMRAGPRVPGLCQVRSPRQVVRQGRHQVGTRACGMVVGLRQQQGLTEVPHHRVDIVPRVVHVRQPGRTERVQREQPPGSAEGVSAAHFVARGQAQIGEVAHQPIGQTQPGADGRVRARRVAGTYRLQLGACPVVMALACQIAGPLGTQAVGSERIDSRRNGRVEPRQQALRLGAHAVRRSNASRYLAAVASATDSGSAGAGACLFQGWPSTCTCSSQSRTNCLS